MPIELLMLIIVTSALVVLIIIFTVAIMKIWGAIERKGDARGVHSSSLSSLGMSQEEMFKYLVEKVNELHPITIPDARPGVEQLADLAESNWHLEKTIAKEKALSSNNARSIKSYMLRIRDFLEKNGIEVADFSNKKYNPGLNVNVSFVEEEGVTSPYIKQVLSPEIRYNGAIFRKSNVIVARDSGKE